MPKHTSAAEAPALRVAIITLDNHLAGAVERANETLKSEIPGLSVTLHAAVEWADDADALAACRAAINDADIVLVTMLFMEEHIKPILPTLQARRNSCSAMVAFVSASEVVRLTRMGEFRMGGRQNPALALLKRLRGGGRNNTESGAKQMAMLRRLPRILRFIPGTAQDVRAFFLVMQYWLAGSEENIANMIRFLAGRYAPAGRAEAASRIRAAAPIEYPDVGVYHPRMRGRIAASADRLPTSKEANKGTVGLLVMRAHVLSGDTAHYDGVVAELESRGLRVVPAFASGLDQRPAIRSCFMKNDKATVDAVVSLTGFSLVGGPAYNDAYAAEEMLTELDVPYIAACPVGFQTLEQWEDSDQGLLPLESTMMVAIPELDGATGSMIYGGRSVARDANGQDMHAHPGRISALAARVQRLIRLRQTPRAERKLSIVLFNFPPNGGATGTAAHLSVFESVFNTLQALDEAGYDVAMPASVDDLRHRILHGNAEAHGTDANVCARIPVDDHVRRETWLKDIEATWGAAPGRHQTDGRSIFVLGERFGNVLVAVQPAFGYEGDPMRLLFEKGHAPTHAFSAFYRYLREDFGAHAVLHFGTHGALEFMPGKQVGLSDACWPDRLIGDLPNFNLYAANNPSEGALAKRRAAATLISHLTPSITRAGLYKGLVEVRDSITRWRGLSPDAARERAMLAALIQEQAAALDMAEAEPAWDTQAETRIPALDTELRELERTLIPEGLHVIGEVPSRAARVDLMGAIAQSAHGREFPPEVIEALVDGEAVERAARAGGLGRDGDTLATLRALAETDRLLSEHHELPAVIHALDGRFVRPAPGGDLLRTGNVLPTGRNIYSFDPFRLPSAFAVVEGARQAERILARHQADGGAFPESIAFVLWGTDNLKTEGMPLAQAMALMGARPRHDSFGRVAGAELIALEELGRPRVDVIATLSGIFRDLLPLQTRMLAEACYLAATADEPLQRNFVRKHALQIMDSEGCDLETAALRVFSNADGAYGSNVNQMIDAGCWSDEGEIAETYTRRKCFAFGRSGRPTQRMDLLQRMLGEVDLTYQNLDSVEVGVTTLDHYFDTLGGISRAVAERKGEGVPVYIGDQTTGEGTVRTLAQQVALETRTRTLNPRWYEGMLRHGYEGVRQIEAQITNTLGWSATTSQVDPWVYQQFTQTFVLDQAMRDRLAELNPKASAKVANRLLEAHERKYWSPDEATLDALRRASEAIEDRMEGITEGVAA